MKPRTVIGIAISSAVLLAAGWFVAAASFTSWDFRNNLWAPAYLLWHGSSPYDVTGLFPYTTALWFPQIITIFAPLGLLPLETATNIWLLVNIALLAILIWRLAGVPTGQPPTPRLWLGIAVAIVLFPPTASHLILGQVDLILAAAILAGALALEKGRIELAGLLLAVGLVKPQLCVLVAPGMLAYLFFVQRDRRGTLRLLLVTCVCTLVLALPLWTTGASWPQDLVSNIRGIPSYGQPSIFSQLSRRFGLAGSALWLAAFGAALAISLRLWSRLRPLRAALWALALTTLVSPYVWGWDFVLLLPLFVDTAVRVRYRMPRVVLFGFMVLCPVLTIASIQGANAGNDSLWWIPFELTTGILVSLILEQRMQGSLAAQPS